jgi:hypothetical protein
MPNNRAAKTVGTSHIIIVVAKCLFPIRTLKRAEARAPERGIYTASSFAVREARILSGNFIWRSLYQLAVGPQSTNMNSVLLKSTRQALVRPCCRA